MREIELFRTLKEAYENSTRKDNLFKKEIDKIDWDYSYKTDDGSIVYVAGDFSIECFNKDGVPNPFTDFIKPNVMYGNEIVYF